MRSKNWPVMLEVVRRVQSVVPNVRWIVGSYRDRQMLRVRNCRRQIRKSVALFRKSDTGGD
ncbi:MAG: hypothetical protein U0936_03650 [Planctomycetaceae bacterium]